MENTTNDSNVSSAMTCTYDYCTEDTLYRKIMGSIFFVIVWPFIVLDMKWFPLGRPAAALVGATFMVIFLVVPQDQVFHILGDKGILQTICLLLGMMLLSYIMTERDCFVLRLCGSLAAANLSSMCFGRYVSSLHFCWPSLQMTPHALSSLPS